MTGRLSDEDRESVCICPELLSVNVAAEEAFIIAACDRHTAAVKAITARAVAEALTEAADAIEQACPPRRTDAAHGRLDAARLVRARIPN